MSRPLRRLSPRTVGNNPRAAARFRARPLLQALEGRVAPAIFTVTNVNDAGNGSLRQAILNANSVAGPDTIVFDPAVFATPQTISLTSGELLVSQDVAITGPGAGLLTVRRDPAAASDFRVFDFNFPAGGPGATLSGITIRGGRAANGGAVGVFGATQESVTIQDAVITGNFASGLGGGLYVGIPTLTLRNTTVSGNTAATSAGGIAAVGNMDVENSTVSGNTATAQLGGGILLSSSNSGWTIRNSTVTGNTAGSSGGGISVPINGGSALSIQNSTIAVNTANGTGSGQGGGGIAVAAGAGMVVAITSTIVADNAAASGLDVLGPVTANFSLIQNPVGSTISGGNNLFADPRLGSLADNGGPTQTMALLAGSPAINAGSNPASLATDQRGPGFPRVAGTAPDIGAFEVQPPPLIVTNVNDSGNGSLRQQIANANSVVGPDTIVFDPSVFATPQTISLTSGELFITQDLAINGAGAGLLTVRRDPAAATDFRIFDFNFPGGGPGSTLSGMTISGGRSNLGGAVALTGSANAAVTIQDSVVTGNFATARGGGFYVGSKLQTTTLTIRNSTVSSNTCNATGGGAYVVGGSLVVENSTISGNTASTGFGGGIGIYDRPAGTWTVSNSTVAGNTAVNGGGIALSVGSGLGNSLTIQNSTIASNMATGTGSGQGGGGIAHLGGNASTINLVSTIVANNTAGTAALDALGAVTANSSLIRNPAGATVSGSGDVFGADPRLGPLQNNGGATLTMALLPGSPAIDTGSNPAGLTTDQRGAGFARAVGPAVDIGAFEVQPVAVQSVVIDNGTAQRSLVRSITVTFSGLVTFTGPITNAFQLKRTGPGTTGVVTLAVDVSGSTATQTDARLTFSGSLTEGANSLVDGNYTLTVFSAQVQGGLQGGDNTTNLFRLYGDVNGDKAVDGFDLTAFRSAFGSVQGNASYVPFLDFNGDGAIDGADLTAFRNRFGVILP
jgi:parallel beta-helix repeat protein